MRHSTVDVSPKIQVEDQFVDDLYRPSNEFNIAHARNSLPSSFIAVNGDQNMAKQIRDADVGMLNKSLRNVLRHAEQGIDDLSNKSNAIRKTMKDGDITTRLPAAQTLCGKIVKLKPRIQCIVQYQTTIGVEIN
jgi:hypothetical protein